MFLSRFGPILAQNRPLFSTNLILAARKRRRQRTDYLRRGQADKVYKGHDYDTKQELQQSVQNDLISKERVQHFFDPNKKIDLKKVFAQNEKKHRPLGLNKKMNDKTKKHFTTEFFFIQIFFPSK